MNSSISSSEREADWTRWLGVFACTLVFAAALLLAFLVVVDPYDSGRFGLLGIDGISDVNPNTANASRARDRQFNAAIIGNSTGELLKPAELSRLTRLRFVQLTVPGTGPREQLSILDFFIRHHDHIGAVVVAVDKLWCSRDAALPPPHPFPFWLYDAGRLDYAGHIFSLRSLGRAWRRIEIGRGRRQRSAPDGYWDYAALGGPAFQPQEATSTDTTPDFSGTLSEDFPAVARLTAALARLPADVPLVLVVPPIFHTQLPRAGSRAAAEDAACKRALRRVAEARHGGRFIDYRVDNALTRDPSSFRDLFHTSHKAARVMERAITEQLRGE